jgi:mannose-6-phosphate isomerase-like protein (cupin superfamily)
MPSDQSKRLTPENLGAGVHDPKDFVQFSPDEGFVVSMYVDPHLTISIWNLEPGQENAAHVHPNRVHAMMLISGNGLYLRGDEEPVPFKTGQCAIAPVGVIHGVRNTGTEPLSCMIISSTTGSEEYVRKYV